MRFEQKARGYHAHASPQRRFAEALAAGRGVTGYAAGSVAAHELRQLADELETLAGLTIGDADHD